MKASALLDTPPEESFDRLTRLAVRLLNVPVAFVSLVDEFRDFYKSHCGFGEPVATIRELEGTTFCHYAIESDGPLIIPDTRADPVFRNVPTVETLGVAAYAGVPIRTAEGVALGSFCAIDFVPREWTESQIEVLTELALSAEREIQLRAAADRSQRDATDATAMNEKLHSQAAELRRYLEERQELLQLAIRSQQEAEDANRTKSQFLANMSHELRTPINAILGYSDLLDVGIGGRLAPQQQDYVDRIRRSGTHLSGLISEILDFAKLESGEFKMELSALRLAAATDGALSMILPQAAAKGLVIVEDSSCSADATFSGDESRVRQIVLNLLSNAVKFTQADGTIRVSCGTSTRGPLGKESAGEWLTINVEDSGIGIAEEHLQDVFEPFRQVDSLHTRRSEGTGLGLAISRKLANLMGGELTVRSELGKGSCFTLWLRPIATPAADTE